MVRAAFVSPFENRIHLFRGDDHRSAEAMASLQTICPLAQGAFGHFDAAAGEYLHPFGGGAAGVEDG
jgi:hypothetical protein